MLLCLLTFTLEHFWQRPGYWEFDLTRRKPAVRQAKPSTENCLFPSRCGWTSMMDGVCAGTSMACRTAISVFKVWKPFSWNQISGHRQKIQDTQLGNATRSLAVHTRKVLALLMPTYLKVQQQHPKKPHSHNLILFALKAGEAS